MTIPSSVEHIDCDAVFGGSKYIRKVYYNGTIQEMLEKEGVSFTYFYRDLYLAIQCKDGQFPSE